MISFIQQILQKHHKWVFSILLCVIIIAFVFTIGATPGIVGKKKTAMFYGVNLFSKKDVQPLINSAVISSLVSGKMIYSQEQLDSVILMRCALLAQADKLLIPEANDKVLADFMSNLPLLCGEDGKFSQERYRSFLDICSKRGFTNSEIKQALIDEQRINILGRVISGNGYVSDHHLQTILSTFYSKYDIIVGDLCYDTFTYNDVVTGDELKLFYDQHAGRYSLPEMVAVSIVRFNADNLRDDIIPPTDEILEKFFTANSERFREYESFQTAHDKVLNEFLSLEARKLANKQADEFVYSLYNNDIQLNTEQFNELLNKFGLVKEKVAVYSKLKLPIVVGVPESALLEVCDLDAARYYSDPFLTDFGAAVLLIEGRKDARILSFNEARAYIEKDVFEEKKHERFESFIKDLKQEISENLSEEQVFNKFRAYKVEYKKYENISLSVDPNVVSLDIWGAINNISSDENVGLMQNEKNVSFIVVLRRDTPEMDEMIKLNNGVIKNNLLRSNREFEFVEYATDLVRRELAKLKRN